MRVDIKPQWRKLANWYWDTCEGKVVHNKGMSIWEMLSHEYGARKVFNINSMRDDTRMWVVFPDEQAYLMFVLRWS